MTAHTKSKRRVPKRSRSSPKLEERPRERPPRDALLAHHSHGTRLTPQGGWGAPRRGTAALGLLQHLPAGFTRARETPSVQHAAFLHKSRADSLLCFGSGGALPGYVELLGQTAHKPSPPSVNSFVTAESSAAANLGQARCKGRAATHDKCSWAPSPEKRLKLAPDSCSELQSTRREKELISKKTTVRPEPTRSPPHVTLTKEQKCKEKK